MAAAAKAATRVLLKRVNLQRIDSTLPNGDTVNFALKRCELGDDRAICSIVKDAGDDPDCTHLAELVAEVRLTQKPGIIIKAGSGVATVTKPGLGLDVGGPSITPTPRKNIIQMIEEEISETRNAKEFGIELTISVPRGEEMAMETTNARLGLLGGISILGTTGIVKPYSTAAYRTSIVQAIDVASVYGYKELVLTTGGKSEQYAMGMLSHLPEDAFIQVGDFIGTGVKHAKKKGIPRIYIFGMMGKLAKMADGVIQTHQAGSSVNMELLAELAIGLGATDAARMEILNANTARHVLEICKSYGIVGLQDAICKRVVSVMQNHAAGASRTELTLDSVNPRDGFEIVSCLVDFDGTKLGEYPTIQGLTKYTKEGKS